MKGLVHDHLYTSGWLNIAVQQDRKIIAVGGNIHYNKAVQGEWNGPRDNDVIVARFLPNSILDSSFGNAGRIVADLGLIENATSLSFSRMVK